MKIFFELILILFIQILFLKAYADVNFPAFPNAQGGGMYTKGARASKNFKIYHITNLNDDGEGSFREAVSKSNRIIIFDVAGTIMLKTPVRINADNLTILGQTSPDEGICIGGSNVIFENCSNIILRYLRFRPGDLSKEVEDGLFFLNCENVIVDHSSISWAIDECMSAVANKNFTLQYSIVAEGLANSFHPKGIHSYGGIWGGINSSFHHNLISSTYGRMPRIGTSYTVSSYNNTPDYQSLVDIRNNVFYNWQNYSGDGGENGIRVNIINNYYIPTINNPKEQFFYKLYRGKKVWEQHYILTAT